MNALAHMCIGFGSVIGPEALRLTDFADFMREVTGFAIGGIPPSGHKTKIQTFIDEDLMNHIAYGPRPAIPQAVFCQTSSQLVAFAWATS